MSLIRQLWIAVVAVSIVAFCGSFAVSTLTARSYLEQQMQRQNIDTANSLALSMSQQTKDAATVELQVAALFDGGHYESIVVTDPFGKTLVERVRAGTGTGGVAPAWLVRALPIDTVPGRAQVTDGWKQFGVVSVVTDDRFAYEALWHGLLQLAGWFLVALLASGVIGTWLIRGIKRPLDAVVAQAQAIAHRQFVSIREPRTPELRSVVRAMNEMVGRVRQMFSDEGARLETLRQEVNYDPVTGLANRDYFMAHLRDALTSEDASSAGCLALVRLLDLEDINRRLGRVRTDALLEALGAALEPGAESRSGQRAGRVKGAELAVLYPALVSPGAAASDLLQRLQRDVLPTWSADVPDLFSIAAVIYRRGDSAGDVLARADEALAIAASKGSNNWHAEEAVRDRAPLPAEQWRALLTQAIAAGQFELAFYPVVDCEGQTLHAEGVIRLRTSPGGALLAAGDFMPVAARLNLTAPVDLAVVKLAIRHLETVTGDVAVNLSAEAIEDWAFRNDFRKVLEDHAVLCSRLWLEVPEHGVFRHFAAFQGLCEMLKALGCRVGIEHFGQRFADSGRLAALGLDYVKVHASYVRGIDQNAGNQAFLQGLCNAAHALGISVIALGVQQPTELATLRELGFDGATGPAIRT